MINVSYFILGYPEALTREMRRGPNEQEDVTDTKEVNAISKHGGATFLKGGKGIIILQYRLLIYIYISKSILLCYIT